ncbi:MAG: ABC transporter ATP-binding protein [Acidimicrobiales bacterium]
MGLCVGAAWQGLGERQIVVSHLTKDFGAVRAVDDLSFSVAPGSVTGFLGPNGAGKTTTLRCILGLVRPTSGVATIGGRRYVDLPRPLQTVGAALEASSFHPGRTARNHLLVLCAAAGLADARAGEVLELTGMTEAADRRVGGFSTGMRQRLGLAATLLGDPEVLVLDEPATGLDPAGVTWLRQLLRYLALERGKTVLVSSHLLGEMEQTADSIVIIARGKLVRQGTLAELTSNASGAAVRVRTPQPERLLTVLSDAGCHADVGDGVVVVRHADAARVGHLAFANGIELHELTDERTDLEQVFLELTGAAPAGPADVYGGRG